MRVWWILFAVACSGKSEEAECEPAPGIICAWAGTGQAGFNGEGLPKTESTLYFPMDIVFSPYGKPVLSDWNNHKLRLVEDDDTLTTIMGTNFVGDGDVDRLDSTVAGAPGTEVALNHPTQQRYFSDGTLLSASWHTHKIRTWDPETGMVHVLAGATPAFEGDNNEDVGTARFNQPVSVELDADENVWVVDMRNERVRMIDMTARTIITTVGSGEQGYCGDGGLAREACLRFPRSENPEPGGALAFTPDGTQMYVVDTENHVIRIVDLQTRTIELYAGSPENPGDADGDRLSAMFDHPRDIELAPDGTLFVADSDNHKIRAIDTNTGVVSTYVGTGAPTCEGDGPMLVPRVCDAQATSGDAGEALDAALYRPFGVALDLDGNLVVADTFNHRIRIVYR